MAFLIFLASMVVLTILGVAVLFVRTLRREDRAKQSAAPHTCRRCGYELAGLPGDRCPECGGDDAAWLRQKQVDRRRLLSFDQILVLTAIPLLGMVLLLVIFLARR